jgi:predicted ribonuclease YlaK
VAPDIHRPARARLATRQQGGSVQLMTTTLTDRLAARAMMLAADAFDDDAAIRELRELAAGGEEALEQAIRVCLAQPASLASRHRAIELLARVRYEDAPPS